MTTNARDEKWSEWIDWSGGECPLPDDTVHQVRFRNGETSEDDHSGPGTWHWNHEGVAGDIIAYRYKIKEPESEMHPDLEWLARNTRPKQFGQMSVRRNRDFHSGYQWSDRRRTGDGWYLHYKVKAARQQLGLDQPAVTPEEEEAWKAKERSLYGEIKEGFDSLEAERTDNINKPKHYQLHEGYEVYDLRQDLAAKAANGGATYDQYSDWDRAIEYIIRMWGKNRLEDAKKGRWYLDKLIGKLEDQE